MVLKAVRPAGGHPVAVVVFAIEQGVAVVVYRVVADLISSGEDRGVVVVAVAVLCRHAVVVDIGGCAVVVVVGYVVVVGGSSNRTVNINSNFNSNINPRRR